MGSVRRDGKSPGQVDTQAHRQFGNADTSSANSQAHRETST